MSLVPALTLTVLVIATAYELAFALGALEIGNLPGEGPRGCGLAVLAGVLGMTVGAVLAATYAARPEQAGALAALLAPASAVFIAARFYTYDPYYAPTLRRISEGGVISDTWIYGLVGLTLLATALAKFRPAGGFALSSFVIVLCIITPLGESAGH